MEEVKKKNNISYIDIYAKELLNEIKARVKQNCVILNNEAETDKKMIEIIKELCNGKYDKSSDKDHIQFSIVPNGTEEDTERVICTLIMYYTAMYFDNLELLNKLLEKGYNFGHVRYELDLFILDNRITNSFDEKQYHDLITNKYPLFKKFYESLKYDKSNEKNDDEYIKIFSEILKTNPKIADKKEDNFYERLMSHLITKKTIDMFGKEMILSSSYEQRDNIINSWETFGSKVTNEERERLIDLMINHNLSMDVSFRWHEICTNLSDEEILEVEEYQEKYDIDLYHECHDKANYRKVDFNAIKKILKKEHKKLRKQRNH